jgi:predicted RNA-binding Zn-ribbon protein involved in translation (DUF1610 family)
MTVEVIQTKALPSGYEFHCPGCDLLFSVSVEKTSVITYCPVCGWDTLIKDRKEFETAYPFRAGRAGYAS